MATINKKPAAVPVSAPAKVDTVAKTEPAAAAPAAAASAPADAASASASAPDDQALRAALGQAAAAGDFRTVYMAYDADKRFVQEPPQKMPDGYDPSGRPWY